MAQGNNLKVVRRIMGWNAFSQKRRLFTKSEWLPTLSASIYYQFTNKKPYPDRIWFHNALLDGIHFSEARICQSFDIGLRYEFPAAGRSDSCSRRFWSGLE